MKNYDNFNFEEFKEKTQNGHLAITTEEEWKEFIKYLAAYYGFPPESYTTPSYELLQNGLGIFGTKQSLMHKHSHWMKLSCVQIVPLNTLWKIFVIIHLYHQKMGF